jgi:hypothetical protein
LEVVEELDGLKELVMMEVLEEVLHFMVQEEKVFRGKVMMAALEV